MAYFLPSSIQKRLLRYALSRLELLDTDKLDLENLDIAWGRRSTVELRDVGLRIQVRVGDAIEIVFQANATWVTETGDLAASPRRAAARYCQDPTSSSHCALRHLQ